MDPWNRKIVRLDNFTAGPATTTGLRSVLSISALCLLAFAAVADAQDAVDPGELDRSFAELLAYDSGGDGGVLDYITAYVDRATGRYKIRVDAERRLLGILESRVSSAAAKAYAAKQLYRLCDEDTVPALRALLLRQDTSDLARKGLERIDHPDAQEALLYAFDRATGSVLTGIVESLGERRDPSAVDPLRRLAKSGNIAITRVALDALSKIPGRASMHALDWCRRNLSWKMRPEATEAYIRCGWTCLEYGDYETAGDLFDVLLIDAETMEIRVEGLRGLIRAERQDAVPIIIDALSSGEPALQATAAEEAGSVPGRAATEAFIKYFPSVTPENQVILLHVFGERGDEAALPAILLAFVSRLPEIRIAAIEAAAKFDHPDILQPLLKAVASGSETEQRLARAALEGLQGPRLNDALVKAAMNADNAIRSEAVRTIAVRRTPSAVPVLRRIAERDVRDIRFEALKAMGAVGGDDELRLMVEMLAEDWEQDEREAIARAVVAVARRSADKKTRTITVSNALKKGSPDDEVLVSLVSILGALQDDDALPALQTHARKRSGPSARAALEVLAGWPNDKPLDTLYRVASSAKESTQRDAAFSAYLGLIARHVRLRLLERTVSHYEQAAGMASSPDQKRSIIRGLRAVPHSGSLALLETFLDDEAVAREAAQAREEVAGTL